MLRKKQLMLAGLIVVLGAAVYLNWRFTDNLQMTGQNTSQENSGHTYGEAQLAGTEASEPSEEPTAAAVMAQAKVSRRQQRETAMAKLEKLVESLDVTDAQKKEALAEVTAMTANAALESELETLICAKGFASSMVYYHEDLVEVLVESKDPLTADQVTQIRDVLLSKAPIRADQIKISTVA